MKLTREQIEQLRQLVESEDTELPGAVGRTGTALVRLGLAVRLGRCTYSGGSYGERPDVWIRFELTPKGKRLAKQLGIQSRKQRGHAKWRY